MSTTVDFSAARRSGIELPSRSVQSILKYAARCGFAGIQVRSPDLVFSDPAQPGRQFLPALLSQLDKLGQLHHL
jgi:hypothetical protein